MPTVAHKSTRQARGRACRGLARLCQRARTRANVRSPLVGPRLGELVESLMRVVVVAVVAQCAERGEISWRLIFSFSQGGFPITRSKPSGATSFQTAAPPCGCHRAGDDPQALRPMPVRSRAKRARALRLGARPRDRGHMPIPHEVIERPCSRRRPRARRRRGGCRCRSRDQRPLPRLSGFSSIARCARNCQAEIRVVGARLALLGVGERLTGKRGQRQRRG